MINNFSGVCVCGHSFDDHHHGAVLNEEAVKDKHRIINGVIGQECEAEQFEGMPLVDNPCDCNCYIDNNWVS